MAGRSLVWYYKTFGTEVGTIKVFVPPTIRFLMTRISSSSGVWTTRATAFAAARAQRTTYVGDVNAASPNMGSTLLFSRDTAMYFGLPCSSHHAQNASEASA